MVSDVVQQDEEEKKKKFFVSFCLGKVFIVPKYIRGIDLEEGEDMHGNTVFRIILDRTNDIKKLEYSDEKEREIDFLQIKDILEQSGFTFI
jgi:hypothetical protein